MTKMSLVETSEKEAKTNPKQVKTPKKGEVENNLKRVETNPKGRSRNHSN
jgi:hypothetical protein